MLNSKHAPVAFEWQGRMRRVKEVQECWRFAGAWWDGETERTFFRVLAGSGGIWSGDEIPHLAAGLYHLIFGYFANAALLEAVLPDDPRSPAALARQAQFLKVAVARLLGGDAAPVRAARTGKTP